ncbi:hypothetical protein JW926_05020 [Candidatus Sumerlaeota bacterium]|nr:hypothetical protein [Candidatus Sumerlaeota bacterium]
MSVFRSHKTALVLFFILSASLLSWAQEAKEPITISGRASSSEISIGDQFTYELKVEWREGYEVLRVEPPLEMGKFEILEVKPEILSGKKGTENARIYAYAISTYDTGEFEIPAFTVTYKTPAGEEKTAQSQIIKINVKPILQTAEDTRDIRDIKSPLSIPAKPYLRNFLIGSGVLLLVLLIAAYLIRRHLLSRKKREPEEWVPPRPIEEIALEEIATLEKSSLLEEGKIKEYYTRISEIIRVYLGRRYRVNAIDLTSYELLRALEEKEIHDEAFKILEGFFDTCDLVKFAKFKPDQSLHRAVMEKARFIVKETTPAPVVPAKEFTTNAKDRPDSGEAASPEPVSATKGGANP